ncbi:MAG: ankyrin repeat domain-containing protein [Bacteroidia bacterium]|nr:ankyrin repeat domain-containing protein [Bacteroidia bacterium]
MNRKKFLQSVGLGTSALFLSPSVLLGQDDKPAAYARDIVQSFVGAGHNDVDKVKSLYAEFPNLIYAAHDWGNGDFESALEAGGHVGHKEMVNFLLEKGARPTLHALTMLGKTELVKPMIEAYPDLLHCLGPHGFTFLHHAQKGGEDAAELLEYFQSKGLKETFVPIKKG